MISYFLFDSSVMLSGLIQVILVGSICPVWGLNNHSSWGILNSSYHDANMYFLLFLKWRGWKKYTQRPLY